MLSWHAAQLERGVFLVAGQAGVALRSEDGIAWQTVQTGTQVDLYGSYADAQSRWFFLLGRNFRSAVLDASGGEVIAIGERIVRLTLQRLAATCC